MKKLTRVKLINWHRFTNDIIEFENSTLISGENGAGKSTLLDAIQFVVTCTTNYFNKAAHENGKRKLTGYIRCKTGRENKPYERTGEISAHVQKALGYGISGDTRYECMFFLYGETTRNGKGTLMESVLSVMGDYGRAVRPETIALKSNNNSSNPTEDIARLAGIRFANISEPSRGLFLNAAQVKNMTGNDTLNARFLHENSFDFKPQFKLYVNTNYLPVINDMTIFSSNRVHIIPFDRHFEEWEQDKSLKSEFATDGAKSAILN